jgi:hypothetical protein
MFNKKAPREEVLKAIILDTLKNETSTTEEKSSILQYLFSRIGAKKSTELLKKCGLSNKDAAECADLKKLASATIEFYETQPKQTLDIKGALETVKRIITGAVNEDTGKRTIDVSDVLKKAVFNALTPILSLKVKNLEKHQGHITRKLLKAEGAKLSVIEEAKEIGFKLAKSLNYLAGNKNDIRRELDRQLDNLKSSPQAPKYLAKVRTVRKNKEKTTERE